MGKIIGIDLGSTLSEVAIMEGNQPTIIVNDEGHRTTPSVISFSKDGERNTNQTSNSTNNERNKSFPNLNVFYSKNFKKAKIVVEINNFESCRLEHSEKMYN